MEKQSTYLSSTVGFWIIHGQEDVLSEIGFQHEKPGFPQKETPLLREAKKQLEAYFSKALKQFDLPLSTKAYPQFYQHVWNSVSAIPYGSVSTYSAVAQAIGNRHAVQAVGQANSKNPFPLIIPCHRVIAKSGNLTGYVYGLEIKRWLLIHEGTLSFQSSLF